MTKGAKVSSKGKERERGIWFGFGSTLQQTMINRGSDVWILWMVGGGEIEPFANVLLVQNAQALGGGGGVTMQREREKERKKES